MCGLWGACGAITSIGAVLSIIDETGLISDDGMWGEPHVFHITGNRRTWRNQWAEMQQKRCDDTVCAWG